MKVLKTKNFTQGYYTACCGPRSIKILADYYKIPATNNSLVVRCNTSKKTGTHERDMERVLSELGLKLEKISKTNFNSDIRKSINSGKPVVILFRSYVDESHYAVIVGYTDKHFIFEDPTYGSKYKRARGEVKFLAIESGYWWVYSVSKE